MHRSSESVAALAAALAKAQIELVNPEKSLTASISNGRRGEGRQTFRYAPLASGLAIVRQTLGKHELAVLQTTAVDQPSGLVSLTTLLAHSSGEWISSDWPVCQLADLAVPYRMGAALTYARRYALFALVGIAGEDDLDAPDLMTEPARSLTSEAAVELGVGKAIESGATTAPRAGIPPPRNRPLQTQARPPVLATDQSAALRDELVAQIGGLAASDQAAQWARRGLVEKNQLTDADAKSVEQAFAWRVASLNAENPTDIGPSVDAMAGEVTAPNEAPNGPQFATLRPCDASSEAKYLVAAAPPRRRDKAHLKYVAKQPCVVCGRQPSDPHHLRFTQPPALGRKVSDEFTVPLCRSHHRELHRASNEASWWAKWSIDALAVAARLWSQTHAVAPARENDRPEPIASPPRDRRRGLSPQTAMPPRADPGHSIHVHDLAKAD